MRTMKNELNRLFGKVLGGSSEGEAKRRAVKPGSEEWKDMARPGSLVKVIGYLSLLQGSSSGGPSRNG